jgi:hypothetical protein
MKRENIRDSETRKKDRSHRSAKRMVRPKPDRAKEISDADLDKVAGGVVGPCNLRAPHKV